LAEFQERNAQVLSISCDSRYSHAIFAEQMGGIGFPMLSDFHPHAAITHAYNVWNPDRGCAKRSVFVIDEKGILRWQKVYPPGTLPEMPELLEALDGLK